MGIKNEIPSYVLYEIKTNTDVIIALWILLIFGNDFEFRT